MRLSMNLELQDIPGQLLLALQPLSENKANIISVVHHRENMTPRGMIPVRLMVEIDPFQDRASPDKAQGERHHSGQGGRGPLH